MSDKRAGLQWIAQVPNKYYSAIFGGEDAVYRRLLACASIPIREDKLGLDAIYIQAKRWEGTVGRPVVQAFAGSLEGQRARKGVLITASQFSQDARDYVTRIEKKIVLIDGDELTRFMIDRSVGIAEDASYVVKRLDIDYFDKG